MRVRLTTVIMLIAVLPVVLAGTSYENATWMQPNGTASGFEFVASETFYTQFNLTAGSVYELRTEGAGSVDTYITLRWPNQAAFAENQYNFAQPTGVDSRILFFAPQTDTFYATLTEVENRTGTADIFLTQLGTLTGQMNTTSLTVAPNNTFTITTNVTCTGGPCGTVTAILDPLPELAPQTATVERELPRGVLVQNGRAHVKVTYVEQQRPGLFGLRIAQQARTREVREELDITTLKQLATHPDVLSIEPDFPVYAMLDSSVDSIRADEAIAQVINNVSLRGAGHTVCVIDTGVTYTHPDFGSCNATSNINDGSCPVVVGGYDFVNGDSNPLDDHGHGSHVAGIVASRDATYTGVAPDVKIAALKALDASGGGSLSNVRSSIDWCTTNAEALNITSIVMSLGTATPFVNNCDYLLGSSWVTSVNAARAKNITLFAAAGNEYATYPYLGMSFPGCMSGVVAIGATNDVGVWSSYTKRDLMLDLIGPGDSVVATNYATSGHTSKSGTSMATPHVAGLSALVLQRMQLLHGRTLTPDNVVRMLRSSGVDYTDSSTRPYSGLTRARIDAMNATNTKGVVPMTPGATPFWTPTQNPDTCGSMQDGDTCEHTWTVNATGTPGNYTFFTIYEAEHTTVETDRITVTIATDSIAPVTTDDAPATWQTAPFTITLNTTDGDSGVSYTTYRLGNGSWVNGTVINITSEGNTTLEYYSVDTVGNVEETRVTYALLDATAPVTADDALVGWQNASVNVTLSASDAVSGVSYTTYRVDNVSWTNGTNILLNTTGNYTLSYYSVDVAGNTENTTSITVLVDRDAPNTTDDVPVGWQNASVNVTLSVSDVSSGVLFTSYRVDNGSWTNGTSVVIEEDGNYTLEYYSVDTAGNTEDVRTANVLIDSTAPSTTDDALVGWQNSSVNVTLSTSDAISGVAYTTYRVNGGAWTNGTEVVVSAENQTLIEYYSVDVAGNVETMLNATVRIDTTAPATIDDVPVGWQNSSVTVTLNATDTLSGVSHVVYRIDGGTWANGTSILIEDEGNTTLEYYAVDVVGNTETVQETNVLIETTNATVTNVRTNPPAGPGEQARIVFGASSTSGIASAQLLSPVNANATYSAGTWKVNATFNTSGTQQLLLRTVSAAGRVTEHTPTVLIYEKTQETNASIATERTYPQTRTRLRITSNATVANITVTATNTQPPEVAALSRARRFVNATAQLSSSIDWVLLTIEFNDTDIDGLDTDSLGIAYYDPLGNNWTNLSTGTPPWVIATGVDVDAGYVWANLTQLSMYALTGDAPAEEVEEESSGSSGGSSGGGSSGGGGGGFIPVPRTNSTPENVTPSSNVTMNVTNSTPDNISNATVPVQVPQENTPNNNTPAQELEANDTTEQTSWLARGIPLPALLTGIAMILLGVIVLVYSDRQRTQAKRDEKEYD